MYCRIENKEEKALEVYNHIKYAEGSYVRWKRTTGNPCSHTVYYYALQYSPRLRNESRKQSRFVSMYMWLKQ